MRDEVLIPDDLPVPLLQALTDAAKVNTNYDPRNLVPSVREDILRIFLDEDGELRSAVAQKNRMEYEIARIRARVAQIQPEGKINALWLYETKGASPTEFERSRRTLAKSLQEALTHPADRQTYDMPTTLTDDGKRRWDIGMAWGAVFDPDLVSDSLLSELLDGEKEPNWLNKGDRAIVRLEGRIQRLDLLHEIFRKLDPIPWSPELPDGKQNFRLARIASGPRKGYVLRFQEISGRDSVAVHTLRGAKRSIDHAEHSEEHRRLTFIVQTLKSVVKRLEEEWDDMKAQGMTEELRKLDQVFAELRFVTDKDKVILRGAVQKAIIQINDKNPSAALACIHNIRSHRLVGARRQTIENTIGYLAKDRSMLEAYITHEQAVLESLYRKVQEQMNKKGIHPRIADKDAPITDGERIKICGQLDNLAGEAASIAFYPATVFSEKLGLFLLKSSVALFAGRREEAAENFMRAYVISKLARFWDFLERMYEDFSVRDRAGMGADIDMWKEQMDEESKLLMKRDVAGKTYTPEFNELWQLLRYAIEYLKCALQDYAGETDRGFRREEVKDLKEYISSFDLPRKVKEIASPPAADSQ